MNNFKFFLHWRSIILKTSKKKNYLSVSKIFSKPKWKNKMPKKSLSDRVTKFKDVILAINMIL